MNHWIKTLFNILKLFLIYKKTLEWSWIPVTREWIDSLPDKSHIPSIKYLDWFIWMIVHVQKYYRNQTFWFEVLKLPGTFFGHSANWRRFPPVTLISILKPLKLEVKWWISAELQPHSCVLRWLLLPYYVTKFSCCKT